MLFIPLEVKHALGMKQKVRVTHEHLMEGHPANTQSCPIALALKDAGFTYASVNYNEALLHGPNEMLFKMKFSEDVSQFIRTFDAGVKHKPFSFKARVEAFKRKWYETHN